MILIDKPTGISSNRALQICKTLLNAKKAGHTGSLDPLASGLLPLCFGKATKVAGMFLDSDKSYNVQIRLGVHTDTGDKEGKVVFSSKVSVELAQIEQSLDSFLGEIQQIPPMYSALKRNGQPLYKLARQGIEVARAPRKVTVYRIEIESFNDDLLSLRIKCSKGFYVRSLAMDLGNLLGTGACVETLRRTGVGRFSIAQAVTIEQLEALSNPSHRQNLMIPADEALLHLPRVDIPESDVKTLCQGQAVQTLKPYETGLHEVGLTRLYSADNTFLGLGEVSADGMVSPKRLFI